MRYLLSLILVVALSLPAHAGISAPGGSSGGVTGWPSTNIPGGVTWADALATAFKFGTSTYYWAAYYNVSTGLQLVGVCNSVVNGCDYERQLDSGHYWGISDASSNPVFRILPSAATPKEQYPFSAGHYPLKSVFLSASSLRGDGTNCPASPTLVTISNMIYPTFVCSENNSSRLKFMIPMPPNWDGGVVYFQPMYAQTAADTGSVLLDAAAACRAFGTAFNGTYGTEVNIDDAAVSGSGAIDSTLSAAITPNGTCAASDVLFGYLDVDATTNPTTAAATLHFIGVRVFWSETSLSQ